MFVTVIMDLLIVLILLFGLVHGYKKGFLKSMARPIRFFASLLTAFWLADTISREIIERMIKNPVTNQIKSYLLENCPTITPLNASKELPTLLKFSASLLGVDVSTLSAENTIDEIVDKLASPVVHLVSLIFAFILVYFISKLVYSLFISLISSSFKSGAIGLPNKVLGATFGLLFSAAIAWIVAITFEFVIHSSVLQSVAWAYNFEAGAVFTFFSKNSPIDILLSF